MGEIIWEPIIVQADESVTVVDLRPNVTQERMYNDAFRFKFTRANNASWQYRAGNTSEVNGLWNHAFSRATNVNSRIHFTRVSNGAMVQAGVRGFDDHRVMGMFQGHMHGGTVFLVMNNMNAANYSRANKRAVALHEVGHVLGLEHQPNGANSVMRSDRSNFEDFTGVDKTNLHWRYYSNN